MLSAPTLAILALSRLGMGRGAPSRLACLPACRWTPFVGVSAVPCRPQVGRPRHEHGRHGRKKRKQARRRAKVLPPLAAVECL